MFCCQRLWTLNCTQSSRTGILLSPSCQYHSLLGGEMTRFCSARPPDLFFLPWSLSVYKGLHKVTMKCCDALGSGSRWEQLNMTLKSQRVKDGGWKRWRVKRTHITGVKCHLWAGCTVNRESRTLFFMLTSQTHREWLVCLSLKIRVCYFLLCLPRNVKTKTSHRWAMVASLLYDCRTIATRCDKMLRLSFL